MVTTGDFLKLLIKIIKRKACNSIQNKKEQKHNSYENYRKNNYVTQRNICYLILLLTNLVTSSLSNLWSGPPIILHFLTGLLAVFQAESAIPRWLKGSSRLFPGLISVKLSWSTLKKFQSYISNASLPILLLSIITV